MKQFKDIKLATNLSLGIHISFWAIVIPTISLSLVSIPLIAISIDFNSIFLDTIIDRFFSVLRFCLVSLGCPSEIYSSLPISIPPLLLTLISLYIFYRLFLKFFSYLDLLTILFVYIFSFASFIVLYLIVFSTENIFNNVFLYIRVLLTILGMITISFLIAGMKRESSFGLFKNKMFRMFYRLVISIQKCLLIFCLILFTMAIILNFNMFKSYFKIYDISSFLSIILIFLLFLPNLLIESLSNASFLSPIKNSVVCSSPTNCSPDNKSFNLFKFPIIEQSMNHLVIIAIILFIVLITITAIKRMPRLNSTNFTFIKLENGILNSILNYLLKFVIVFTTFFIINFVVFMFLNGQIGKLEIFFSFFTPLILSLYELLGVCISFGFYKLLNRHQLIK